MRIVLYCIVVEKKVHCEMRVRVRNVFSPGSSCIYTSAQSLKENILYCSLCALTYGRADVRYIIGSKSGKSENDVQCSGKKFSVL